ncbi:MAG: ABC transporter substrate-binding protein [Pseudopedobacter sp.]|nr:ABC transporter substrate-binding protein [Deinococcales bacterium]
MPARDALEPNLNARAHLSSKGASRLCLRCLLELLGHVPALSHLFGAFPLEESAVKPFLVLLALSLGSNTLATTYPLTVTDDLGRSITLKSEPKRIIAMLPSHTETLFALSAGDKLVGIDEYSNFPKALTDKIQKVGNGFQPNLEAIVALKPDLVLADESVSSKLVERLVASGLTVYGGSAQTYNEVFQKINIMGKLVNREKQAINLITQMRNELNTLQKSVLGRPKVSTYYEIDPTPYTVGPNSFIGVLLEKAGGRNIIPKGIGDFPKISPELVVSANPQIIVGAKLEDLKRRPNWAGIAAIQSGKVFEPTPEQGDALSRPGPRLPDALRALISFLHPEVLK